MKKKTIRDLDLAGKRVLMRVDFNVPLKNGVIQDDTRIRGALPTIQHALDAGASVVLMSHLGRPKGERVPEMSLAPVAPALAEKLGREVAFVDDCVGEAATAASAALQPGNVLLLENLRYHGAEKTGDSEFAKQLAAHGDVYVSDAFGTAHRAHASMVGITEHMDDCVAGLLLEKEIQYLDGVLSNPEPKYVAIVGGKKVSDKINVIEALLEKCDTILIGGAMAYPFMKAQGYPIGKSYCTDEDVPIAKALLEKVEALPVNFLTPIDTMTADDFSAEANTEVAKLGDIKDDMEGLDIGPETAALYVEEVASAKTVVWNGPMGVFEMAPFAHGTNAVAQALADNADCTSIIGGGDSVTAVNKAGLADKMTHISTGGGASLELMEGKTLPGLAALDDA